LSNKIRDFWGEVKRLRHSGNTCSSSVDGFTNPGDIVDHFASQYQSLYSSVGYNSDELFDIRRDIDSLIIDWDDNCCVTVHEVYDAICKLKPGKSDGNIGLSSDYFIHAGSALFMHISLLFSGLLVHGCVPECMLTSTVIPIPKGKQANRTDSNNYRGIALSSVFGKLFDLVKSTRYRERLRSCNFQFGFKARRSTDMCTMILKKSIAYYVNHNSSVYCTF